MPARDENNQPIPGTNKPVYYIAASFNAVKLTHKVDASSVIIRPHGEDDIAHRAGSARASAGETEAECTNISMENNGLGVN